MWKSKEVMFYETASLAEKHQRTALALDLKDFFNTSCAFVLRVSYMKIGATAKVAPIRFYNLA